MIPDNLNSFNSFEQCNEVIKELPEVDLDEYLELSKRVPYDHELIRRYPQIQSQSYWMEIIIKFVLEASSLDPREFKIPISDIESLGFNLSDYSSKAPEWFKGLFNYHDDSIKKEQRLLKEYNLIENVDFIMMLDELDGEIIAIGHAISRIVLMKMITMRYGPYFTESLLARIGQILYYWGKYKKSYHSDKVISLQRTIIGLTEDIQELTARLPNREIAFEDSYHTNNLSEVSSGLIMDEKEYVDELSTIHHIIESSINKMDGRISDINVQLTDITSKINDLVGSIALSSDGSRLSTCARCSNMSDPVVDHVNTLFSRYNQIDSSECEQCL